MIDLVTLALAKNMSGGASDYSNLTNKPKLNGVELNGDKSSLDLGIKTKSKIAIVDSFESSEHITPTVYRSTDDWYDYEGGKITLEEAYALADDAPIMFYGGYIGDYYGNQDHKLYYAGTIFEAQSDHVRNYKKIYKCEGYISEYSGETPKKKTLEFVLNKRVTREYDGAEPEINYEITYSIEDEIFNINIAYDYETDSIKSDKSYTEINSAIKKGIPIYVKAVLHANYTYYGIINNTYKSSADEYIRFIGINGETGTEDDNVGIGIIFITIHNDDTVVVHENPNVTGSLYDLATVNKDTFVSAINEVHGLAKQNAITEDNPLSSDLVDDSDSTNKFVTESEKEAWTAKQDALTAGTGIGIENDEIRVTYGESHYGDPVYDAAMKQKQYTGVGTLFCGIAGNYVSNTDLTPLVTADDIIKIVTDETATDCAFSVPTDEYQQKIVWFASLLNITVEYIYCHNCHGLYLSDDLATGYLVKDAAGTEQTDSAYIFALAKSDNDIPVFIVLANTEYPRAGIYTISKLTERSLLPNSAYGFGEVAVGDERPVNGDTVKAALDETTQTISEIAEGRRTVYVFNNEAELDTWLLNPTKQDGSGDPATLYTGDVFLIRDTTEPDYWWDANVTPAVKRTLETRSFVLPAPDWTESSSASPNYIKNKPNIPNTANWSTVTDHTGNAGIHVTTSEKSTWNGKYTKPSGGIPASDIASGVIPTFTAAQLAAINSGVTSTLVGKISTNESAISAAQSSITLLQTEKQNVINSSNKLSASLISEETDKRFMTDAQSTKLNGNLVTGAYNSNALKLAVENGSHTGSDSSTIYFVI